MITEKQTDYLKSMNKDYIDALIDPLHKDDDCSVASCHKEYHICGSSYFTINHCLWFIDLETIKSMSWR